MLEVVKLASPSSSLELREKDLLNSYTKEDWYRFLKESFRRREISWFEINKILELGELRPLQRAAITLYAALQEIERENPINALRIAHYIRKEFIPTRDDLAE